MAIGPEISRMAEYIAATSARELPAEVMWRAKQHFLDSVAAVVSGSALPAGLYALRWMDLTLPGSSGSSSVLGTARTGPAATVALVNGMAAHAQETDDSHAPSLSHPGCSVAPTVLAVGEERASSGAAVLRAYVSGYDIGCRVGRAIQSAYQDRSLGTWSSHSVIGTFCATAAAGSLSDLTPEQARYLLSYASQLASGVTTWMRDPHHVQKAFVFAGMPASHGVLAASLVRAGWDGVDDVFSGLPNWPQAMSAQPELDQLTSELGERFEIMEATIKKYAVGSPSQAAIEAVTELISDTGVRADEIAEVIVHLPSDSATIVDNRSMPNVNVQYLLAGTIIDGKYSNTMSRDEQRLADPDVVALMKKITLVPDATLAYTRAAKLRITRTLASGAETLERDVHDVRGTPKNPMTFDETRTKAEDLIGDVLGSARAAEACDLIARLEDLPDIRELVALLVTA